MTGDVTEKAIPRQVALELCEQIRLDNQGRGLSFGSLMCWTCVIVSSGDAAKMYLSSDSAYRGCVQVNRRFDRRTG
jgi:hypothetical protein